MPSTNMRSPSARSDPLPNAFVVRWAPVPGVDVPSPFQVVAAASTLNETVAGAEGRPAASVTVYRKSTLPPDHVPSV
jgi:hypothetical protein